MITQARERVLLVAAAKLSARGLNAIGPLSEISVVLAHGVSEADLRPLRSFDVPVRVLGSPGAPASGGSSGSPASASAG